MRTVTFLSLNYQNHEAMNLCTKHGTVCCCQSLLAQYYGGDTSIDPKRIIEVLYPCYGHRLHGKALRIVGPDAAEDTTQEAWMDLLRTLQSKTTKIEEPFLYLSRCMQTRCSKYLKNRNKLQTKELKGNEHTDSNERTPEQLWLDAVLQNPEPFKKKLRKILSQTEYEVFLLKFLEGASNQQIAQLLKKTIRRIENIVTDIRRKLRDRRDYLRD